MSSTVAETVPLIVWTRLKLVTSPAVPMECPAASHTRNFAGTVLPCLNVLLPSALIGCRIECPRSPRQAPVEETLMETVVVAGL